MIGVLAFFGLLTFAGLELFVGSSKPVPHLIASAVSDQMSIPEDARAAYAYCVKNRPRWRRTTANAFASLCGCFAETALESVGASHKTNAMRYAIDLVSHQAGSEKDYFPDAAIKGYADTAEEAAAVVLRAADKCVGELMKREKLERN